MRAGDGRCRLGGPPGGGEPHVLTTDALGQRLQPVPGGLWQGRAGIKHHAQPGEKALCLGQVRLQQRQQHVQPTRHVEVQRGLHFTQVAQGFFDRPGGRPALINHQRAAVAQHQVEVVVAAKSVAPGQPVHQHRFFVVQKAPGLANHLLVGAQHAVAVDHHFGVAGGAGCQQVFGMGVGGDQRKSGHHGRAFWRAGELVKWQRAGVAVCALAEHHQRGPAAAGECGNSRPIHRRIRRVDQRRPQGVEDAVDLAVVLRQPAVGAGHGAHRTADVQAGQQQQQVVDGVVRQHHDGRLWRQVQVQQALGNAAHLNAGLGPAQAAPASCGCAVGQGAVGHHTFGKRRCVRRLGGPALQPFPGAAGVGLQRLGRAQHKAAVIKTHPHSARRRQPLRMVKLLGHGSLRCGLVGTGLMLGGNALKCIRVDTGLMH